MVVRWQKEVFRMAVYVGFPVVMFGIFNQPWFYEDAIYQARLAYEKQRDPIAAEMLRKTVELTKQDRLRRNIEARERD